VSSYSQRMVNKPRNMVGWNGRRYMTWIRLKRPKTKQCFQLFFQGQLNQQCSENKNLNFTWNVLVDHHSAGLKSKQKSLNQWKHILSQYFDKRKLKTLNKFIRLTVSSNKMLIDHIKYINIYTICFMFNHGTL